MYYVCTFFWHPLYNFTILFFVLSSEDLPWQKFSCKLSENRNMKVSCWTLPSHACQYKTLPRYCDVAPFFSSISLSFIVPPHVFIILQLSPCLDYDKCEIIYAIYLCTTHTNTHTHTHTYLQRKSNLFFKYVQSFKRIECTVCCSTKPLNILHTEL